MLGLGLGLNKGARPPIIRTATGNSLTLLDTLSSPAIDLQILGETLCKKVVFGTNYLRIDGATNPFATGNMTVTGTSVSANNKSAAITSVSGQYVYFAAGTFTAATELQGTLSDGTNTINIAVSPSDPQTLTSLTSFDYVLRGKNLINVNDISRTAGATYTLNSDGTMAVVTGGSAVACNIDMSDKIKTGTFTIQNISGQTLYVQKSSSDYTTSCAVGATKTFTYNGGYLRILFANFAANTTYTVKLQLETGSTATTWEAYKSVTATISCKDTLGNQKTLAGRVAAYKTDGTPATFIGQDEIVKVNGVWYHRQNGAFEADATTRADFWNLLADPIDTELCAADQTALNLAESTGTFSGIANIMLSTEIGQIYIKYRARR